MGPGDASRLGSSGVPLAGAAGQGGSEDAWQTAGDPLPPPHLLPGVRRARIASAPPQPSAGTAARRHPISHSIAQARRPIDLASPPRPLPDWLALPPAPCPSSFTCAPLIPPAASLQLYSPPSPQWGAVHSVIFWVACSRRLGTHPLPPKFLGVLSDVLLIDLLFLTFQSGELGDVIWEVFYPLKGGSG